MPWTLTPSSRTDIILEISATLDGSGNYSGDWLETTGLSTVLVSCKFNTSSPIPYMWIEHGIYTPGQNSPPFISFTNLFDIDPNDHTQATTSVTLLARYFRLGVWSGSPGAVMNATVRKV